MYRVPVEAAPHRPPPSPGDGCPVLDTGREPVLTLHCTKSTGAQSYDAPGPIGAPRGPESSHLGDLPAVVLSDCPWLGESRGALATSFVDCPSEDICPVTFPIAWAASLPPRFPGARGTMSPCWPPSPPAQNPLQGRPSSPAALWGAHWPVPTPCMVPSPPATPSAGS